jgi:hypothetical protein
LTLPPAAPLPNPALGSFWAVEELMLVAMFLFGEARNQTDDVKRAAAAVARNRRRLNSREFGGSSWRGVLLHAGAFSCFLTSDVNRNKLWRPTVFEPARVWEACYRVAEQVYPDLAHPIHDETQGALFYHDRSLPSPPPPHGFTETPVLDSARGLYQSAWGKVQHTVTLGALTFYARP